MIKFIGIGMCTLLCALLIKNYNKNFAIILSIVGASIMLLLAVDSINDIFNTLFNLTKNFKTSFQYIKLMLKVLSITLISQFVSDLCRENGEIALSSTILLISKVTVITLMLPLFEVIINIILGLVK